MNSLEKADKPSTQSQCLWVCIPVFNRVEFTLKCLASLKKQSFRNFHVVLCDHGSTDNTSKAIRTYFPEVDLISAESSLWWTGAINLCVKYAMDKGDADSDYILTLNNDLEVDTDYLENLVTAASLHKDAIITSAGHDIQTRLLVSPGCRQNWVTSKSKPIEPATDCLPGEQLAEVTHASGRGTLIPMKVFKEIGLYDEQHLPHYGADYDLSFRARRSGYRVLVSFEAKVFSHIDATGLTAIRRDLSWNAFRRYLSDMKSPANLSVRWWLGVRNCPAALLPSYLILDMAFVTASFFKFHFVRGCDAIRGRDMM